jgi:4Fe-4S single cluster domain
MDSQQQPVASKIHFHPINSGIKADKRYLRKQQIGWLQSRKFIFKTNPELKERFEKLNAFSSQIRVSEYSLTNACNIRCKGCWFFEYEHDLASMEVKNLEVLENFLKVEKEQRHISQALIIGGEPSLFLNRLKIFKKVMKYVTVSSNGLRKIPYEGFEDFVIALTLFGGGALDDELRAIKPNGTRFTGLFEKALNNYKNDPRAIFIYAIVEDGIQYIEETVRKIYNNGNTLTFNYYVKYDQAGKVGAFQKQALLEEALRVKRLFPNTVLSHEYYIKTLITGESHWGKFGYEECPNISIDHPAHHGRLQNGNPYIPRLNSWAADLKTVNFCSCSGNCNGCRDSQAILSWLMVNLRHFSSNKKDLTTWVEIAESYWSQFYWSPYGGANRLA